MDFYEGENMLVIHPDECIDCGVCVPNVLWTPFIPIPNPVSKNGSRSMPNMRRNDPISWTRNTAAGRGAWDSVPDKHATQFSNEPARQK